MVDGESVEIRRSHRRVKTVSAHRAEGRIIVSVPARLTQRQQEQWVADMVAKIHKRETRRRAPHSDTDLDARARVLLERHIWPHTDVRREPTAVRWVSNQNRRWGSCTVSTGEIRLSDRMRTFPSWVVDAVLMHELVHLYVSDHSAAFTELMSHYPQAERAEGFLEGWSAAQNAGKEVKPRTPGTPGQR